MSWTEEGKWSCSQCNLTVTIFAPPALTHVMLKAGMEQHAREHRAAAAVLARLPLGNGRRRESGAA